MAADEGSYGTPMAGDGRGGRGLFLFNISYGAGPMTTTGRWVAEGAEAIKVLMALLTLGKW